MTMIETLTILMITMSYCGTMTSILTPDVDIQSTGMSLTAQFCYVIVFQEANFNTQHMSNTFLKCKQLLLFVLNHSIFHHTTVVTMTVTIPLDFMCSIKDEYLFTPRNFIMIWPLYTHSVNVYSY